MDILTGVLLGMECLQAISEKSHYLQDIWNWLDILLISNVITISALFWGQGNASALSFFVSTASILFYTKILLSLRVIDQMRNLIRMIIEVIKDMISFLIIITVYIVAFSIIFFQDRRAVNDKSIDFDNFAGDLMEMFYLIFTGGTTTDYHGVMIPFYVFVTVLQCLILLNLIISIMNNTFDKLKQNSELMELKERINMLLEIAEEANIIVDSAKKLRDRCIKKTSSCLSNIHKF